MTKLANDPSHWESQALFARSVAADAGDRHIRIEARAKADGFERLAAEAGARQAIAVLRTAGRSGPACSAGWHFSLI